MLQKAKQILLRMRYRSHKSSSHFHWFSTGKSQAQTRTCHAKIHVIVNKTERAPPTVLKSSGLTELLPPKMRLPIVLPKSASEVKIVI